MSPQPLRHYHDTGNLTLCGLAIRDPGVLEDKIEIAPFWHGVTCAACCERMEHDITSDAHRVECRACHAEFKKMP